MSKRQRRAQEFKSQRSFAWISFFQDLVSSAYVLLEKASAERSMSEYKSQGGHYSIHAAGSIVLVTTAFDQWLNECCLSLDVAYPGLRNAAPDLDTVQKYVTLCTIISPGTTVETLDLQMAWDVRNEIVHFLPRTTSAGDTWPSWLVELERRGLVQSRKLPHRSGDANDLPSKLHSYKLCYWIWQIMAASIEQVLELFPEDRSVHRESIGWALPVFQVYVNAPA